MIDLTKTINDTKEIIETLTAYKNELMADIKKGDMSLYPKYIEVCTDLLGAQSALSKVC